MIFFFILMTCQLDIVLILLGEIISRSQLSTARNQYNINKICHTCCHFSTYKFWVSLHVRHGSQRQTPVGNLNEINTYIFYIKNNFLKMPSRYFYKHLFKVGYWLSSSFLHHLIKGCFINCRSQQCARH